ncbi:MAG TPA: response regulator, partial [Longimicrobiales bacterium]|nr:response regulator [Longimicrobiales bacterium]
MKSESLLVIEDEAVLAEELVRHFQRGGWETALAADLATARKILRSGTLEPLVVLSDLSLPDGNGLDLLEEVRSSGEDDAEWIFLTGYGTIPDSVRALRLG